MNRSRVRVGMVGAGGNTRERHIPGFRGIEGVEIVAVANRTRASSERVAAEFELGRIHENWADLVKDPDVDAVLIGTWPYMHCPITLAALTAGKHVLCEARMAMNAGEARAMRDAARARPHLVAQVVPSPITLRVDSTVLRLLGEGYLGELLAVEVRDGGQFVDRDAPLHWRHDATLSGLNVMSLGIWYESLTRWIGPASRLTAMGQTVVKTRRDDSGNLRAVRAPDHLDVVAEMDCGAQAHFQISAVTGLDDRRGIFMFGSEATLHFSDGRLFGGRRGAGRLEEISIPPAEEGRWRVEEEFIGAIRGEEQVRLTRFDDGVKYMEFTEAVARSMASERSVSIPV